MEIDGIRFIFAFFAGLFLTVSGSLTQNTTQNNLASPSTLGFDGVAVFCVLVAQGLMHLFDINLSLELSAFLLFNLFFVTIVSLWKKGSSRVNSLDMKVVILIGLGFNLFVGAIFSVVQFLFMALNLRFPTGLWFGSFKFFYNYELLIFFIVFFLLLVFLVKNISSLRLISVGVSFARGVGVEINKVQRLSLLVSFYLTGVVICFFGVFSFISLIIPHILRLIPYVKNDMRREFTIGALIGALALAFLDFLSFNFTFYGAELPVGMVSSVLGSFTLIILLGANYFKSLQK